MMPKFDIPDRPYCGGDKKMVSLRLPTKLMKELELLSKSKGWNVTDLVTTALDQYVQHDKKKTK